VSPRNPVDSERESSIAVNVCRLQKRLADHFGSDAPTAGTLLELAEQLARRQEFYVLFDRIVAARVRVNRFANQPRRKTRKRAHGT